MKKIILFVVLFAIITPAIASFHKYYVSITEITHNLTTNKLEMSSKVFFDELEKTLMVEGDYKISDPIAEHEVAINEYIQQNLKVKVNGEEVTFKLVGVETELDAVWCHFESEVVPKTIKNVNVINSVFVDLYPGQVNIINFFPDKSNTKKVKGLVLNNRKPEDIIKL